MFRPEIFLEYHPQCKGEDELEWIASEAAYLQNRTPKQIIYCRTIDNASRLYQYFAAKQKLIKLVQMYHAHMPVSLKDDIVSEFNDRNSMIRILISTIAFGMGIDVRDIKRVIHWGVPSTIQDYWQEVGRCVRDGSNGVAILYKVKHSVSKDKTVMAMLDRMNSDECIRMHVLKHFKFDWPVIEDVLVASKISRKST